MFFRKMESELDIRGRVCYDKDVKHAFHRGEISAERSLFMKNRLEQLRAQRNLRQEELATALKVSRQTISSLENGRYNPSIQLAFKLAKYFGCTVEDIFIYEEEE